MWVCSSKYDALRLLGGKEDKMIWSELRCLTLGSDKTTYMYTCTGEERISYPLDNLRNVDYGQMMIRSWNNNENSKVLSWQRHCFGLTIMVHHVITCIIRWWEITQQLYLSISCTAQPHLLRQLLGKYTICCIIISRRIPLLWPWESHDVWADDSLLAISLLTKHNTFLFAMAHDVTWLSAAFCNAEMASH